MFRVAYCLNEASYRESLSFAASAAQIACKPAAFGCNMHMHLQAAFDALACAVQMLLDVAQDRDDTIPALIYEARAVVSSPWHSAMLCTIAALQLTWRSLFEVPSLIIQPSAMLRPLLFCLLYLLSVLQLSV